MSANPFWEFSLDFYARPGVAQACIGLQDEAAVDVNLLLFCIWSALEGTGRLAPEDLVRALSLTGGWQAKVIGPLRAARRAARSLGGAGLFANAFRRDIAATELAAERVEQWLLFDEVSERERAALGEAAALEAACANVAGYFGQAGVNAADCRGHLGIVLRAAFPSADIANALSRISTM
jgi:uncharacterized protein (TIGR02444 family)